MTESEAVKRLHALPREGSRVRVTYNCEYNGMEPAARNERKRKNCRDKSWTRLAVVRQKINKDVRSSITVEMQPEQSVGKRGKYVVNFRVTDVMAGVVKIEEVQRGI